MKKFLITAGILITIVVIDVLFVIWIQGMPLIAVSLHTYLGADGTSNTYIGFTPTLSIDKGSVTFTVDDISESEEGLTMTVTGPVIRNASIDEGFNIGQRQRRLPASNTLSKTIEDTFTVTINYGVITDTYTIHREQDQLTITPDRWNLFSTLKNTEAPTFPAGYIFSYCKFSLMTEKNAQPDDHCIDFFTELGSQAIAVDNPPDYSQPFLDQRTFGQWWRYAGSLDDLRDLFERFQDPSYTLFISNGEDSLNYYYNSATADDAVVSVYNPLDTPESFSVVDSALITVELPLGASIALPETWRQNPYGIDTTVLRSFLTHGYNDLGFWAVPTEEFNDDNDDPYIAFSERYVLSQGRLGKPYPLNETVVINGREWHRVAALDRNGKMISDPTIITIYNDNMFVIDLTVSKNRQSMWPAAEEIAEQVVFP